MKPIHLLPFLFFLLTFSAPSCEKSPDSSPAPVTSSDPRVILLTKAVWYKTGEGTDTNRDGNIDVISTRFAQPCNADDKAAFIMDGTLVWYEGPTKCNASDPDTYNLKWNFTGTGIYLIDHDNKIAILNDTIFSIYYEETSGANTTWNMMKFKH